MDPKGLSVQVLVAGRSGWRRGWLNPETYVITTEGQPSELVRPAQVQRIFSCPQREDDVEFVPRERAQPPDPADRGKTVLIGVMLGFDVEDLRAGWPEWVELHAGHARRGRYAVRTLSAVLAVTTTGALALAR